MILKPDEYKAARDLICQARNIFDDDCERCSLYDTYNCYEQTVVCYGFWVYSRI